MSLQLLLMALCLWVIFPIAVSSHVSTPSESGKVKIDCLLLLSLLKRGVIFLSLSVMHICSTPALITSMLLWMDFSITVFLHFHGLVPPSNVKALKTSYESSE